MTRIVWDSSLGVHAGVNRGVMYPKTGPGVGWNGLTSVTEDANGTEAVRYLDGVKTRNRRTRGEFSGSIGAYTYPDELYDNVLVQQRAQTFGLSYRTAAGENYRLHLVYNVVLVPTARTHQQREPGTLTWNFTTLPIDIPLAGRSAHLYVDSRYANPSFMAELEDVLYGTDATDPRLPTPQEVWDMAEAQSVLLVVDHGDGTFTVTGPDEVITMLSATTFEIDWPSVVILNADEYQISSL